MVTWSSKKLSSIKLNNSWKKYSKIPGSLTEPIVLYFKTYIRLSFAWSPGSNNHNCLIDSWKKFLNNSWKSGFIELVIGESLMKNLVECKDFFLLLLFWKWFILSVKRNDYLTSIDKQILAVNYLYVWVGTFILLSRLLYS